MNENHTDNNTPLQSDRRPLRVGDIIVGKVTDKRPGRLLVTVDTQVCILPLKEVSWGNGPWIRRNNGDIVRAVVLMVEDEYVVISQKRLRPDPWKNLNSSDMEGKEYLGTIIHINQYQAKILIDDDFTGSLNREDTQTGPKGKFRTSLIGKLTPITIRKVDVNNRRLKLYSAYDWSSDPWERAKNDFPVNSCHDAFITAINEDSITATLQAGVEAIIMETDPNTAADSYYRLNIKDKVKIKIVDWDMNDQRLIAQLEDSYAN